MHEKSLRNKIKCIDHKLVVNVKSYTKAGHSQNKDNIVETPSNMTDKTVIERRESKDIDADSKIVLSRYKIEKQLGQGAMGRIFFAHDEKLRRNIAVPC